MRSLAADQPHSRQFEHVAPLENIDQSHFDVALLTTLIACSFDGLLVISNNGQILVTNEQLDQLWGTLPQQFARTQTIDVLERLLLELVSEPCTFLTDDVLSNAATLSSWEEIVLRNDTVLEHCTSSVIGRDGISLGRIWHFRDVTERVHVERALKQRETHLVNAHQLAGVGSFEWEIASNELRWNDEIYQMFGLLPGSIRPTFNFFMAHIHPDERENVSQAIMQTLEHGVPYDLDITICCADGTERVTHSRGTIILDSEGNPARLLGTVLDITHHKEVEALLSHQAYHDPLTTLPNRRLMNVQLEETVGHT